MYYKVKLLHPLESLLPTQTTCTFFILTTTYIKNNGRYKCQLEARNCKLFHRQDTLLMKKCYVKRRDCAVPKIIIILPVILNLPN